MSRLGALLIVATLIAASAIAHHFGTIGMTVWWVLEISFMMFVVATAKTKATPVAVCSAAYVLVDLIAKPEILLHSDLFVPPLACLHVAHALHF